MSIYDSIISENKAWVEEVFSKIDSKLSKVAVRSREKIPYTAKDGVHDTRIGPDGYGITWWTNGFWGAMNWLMYEATGNEEYKLTAHRLSAVRSRRTLHPITRRASRFPPYAHLEF